VRSEGAFDEQGLYWMQEYSSGIPLLDLPYDYPRPPVKNFTGDTLFFRLSPGRTEPLYTMAQQGDVTLFMVLFSMLTLLLSRLSGQDDIVVGTPAAGRRHADLENIVGMFVNTLAIPCHINSELPYNRFLEQIKNKLLQAFDFQDFPFEELVEKVESRRDLSRNPLFDVMFVLQNMEKGIHESDSQGLKIKPLPYRRLTSKFDLTFICYEVDNGLQIEVEYRTSLFKSTTIESFFGYYRRLIKAIVSNPDILPAEIEILSDEEKGKILDHFCRESEIYQADQTLPALFLRQVQKHPDEIALKEERIILTYRQLYREARTKAYSLLRYGVTPRKAVGLLVEKSAEMIIGMLAILECGCAYVPLNPKAPASRNRFILKECDVQVLLAQQHLSTSFPGLEDFSVIPLDLMLPLKSQEHYKEESPTVESGAISKIAEAVLPTDPAYIIFTSGSTGVPKGVQISHGNLSPLLHWGYKNLGIGVGDRVLQNLSYYFDWSVWEIFITLTTGAGLYIAAEGILMDPEASTRFMAQNEITTLHVTPTQFQYLVSTTSAMPYLKYLFIGAEKLTYDLVRRSFGIVSNECRVFNMYGPTEATIIAAVLEIHRRDYQEYKNLGSVPIGRPVGNTVLLVLDRYLHLSPLNVAGELYIGGDGVSVGYVNNPELTAEKFVEIGSVGQVGSVRPVGQVRPVGSLKDQLEKHTFLSAEGTTFYKTGDLVRWLPDGMVEFLGRIDDQVKIRGFRIELGEIENRLLEHSEVKEVVVIDSEKTITDGKIKTVERYLCAYIVPEKVTLPTEWSRFSEQLNDFLSHSLPDYMVPSYFIQIDQVPLNPNGKVDRRALPLPEFAGQGIEYVPPQDKVQKELVKIWADVLDIEASSLGIDHHFFRLGGHSLKGTMMVNQVHRVIDISLPLSAVFQYPTIRKLSAHIQGLAHEAFHSIVPVDDREYYSLSPAQRRLYILYTMNPESIAYNITVVFPLDEEPEGSRLEWVIRELINRHESFRTSFIMKEDQPVQRINETIEFTLEFREGAGGPFKGEELTSSRRSPLYPFLEDFTRPFDLSKAPLMRVQLLKIKNNESGHPDQFFLLMDQHHIISDGVSVEIFQREMIRLYNGYTLAPLAIRYRDYSNGMFGETYRENLYRQERYWLEVFQGETPVLDLPIDYPRPKIQDFKGEVLTFHLTGEETEALKGLAMQEDSTLYMVLLSLYALLLSRLSRQEEIIIGTPVAGRRHPELQDIIGMFVNTLAIRLYPRGEQRLYQFLKEV